MLYKSWERNVSKRRTKEWPSIRTLGLGIITDIKTRKIYSTLIQQREKIDEISGTGVSNTEFVEAVAVELAQR